MRKKKCLFMIYLIFLLSLPMIQGCSKSEPSFSINLAHKDQIHADLTTYSEEPNVYMDIHYDLPSSLDAVKYQYEINGEVMDGSTLYLNTK